MGSEAWRAAVMSRQSSQSAQKLRKDEGMAASEPLNLLRQKIVMALESKKEGNSTQYSLLLEQIDSIFQDVAQLRVFVQCVSYFDERAHEVLLMQILGTSLWTCSNEVADVVLEFVVNLVAANPALLHLCLDMLVRNFLPPSCGIPAFMEVLRRGEENGVAAILKAKERKREDLARKDEVLDRVHVTLDRISELVPTVPARLQTIIIQKMPHRRVEKEFQNLYMVGIFRLAEGRAWTALSDHLLAAIIDRLIEIDVEIRWEDIAQQEEVVRKNSKVYLFHMDLDDESDEEILPTEQGRSEASAPGSEAAKQHGLLGPRGRPVPTLDEMANKMDEMMCMTMEHIQLRASRGEIQQVYKALERSFLTTILDTHKSKFTQFLLLFLCSLAPTSHGGDFADLLCNLVVSPTHNVDTRMSAAAYLASFLARLKDLPLSVVMNCLTRLSSWCVKYANLEEERERQQADRVSSMSLLSSPYGSSSGVLRHSVFYSACQAILYVLCYRLQQLLEDPEQEAAVRALPLQRPLTSSLNPLATCLESVVQEFERQATAAKLLDCQKLRDVYTGQHLPPGLSFGGEHRLDMFFPFDPYLLRQSNKYIKPIYIKWQQPSYSSSESESEQASEGEDRTDNESVGEEPSESSDDDDDDDQTPERMAMSMSDRSHAWPSSVEEPSMSPAVRGLHKGVNIHSFVPAGHRTADGTGGKSVGMDSYGSDDFSDQGRSLDPMSFTSPSQFPPLPKKLPSRLPRKLP